MMNGLIPKEASGLDPRSRPAPDSFQTLLEASGPYLRSPTALGPGPRGPRRGEKKIFFFLIFSPENSQGTEERKEKREKRREKREEVQVYR